MCRLKSFPKPRGFVPRLGKDVSVSAIDGLLEQRIRCWKQNATGASDRCFNTSSSHGTEFRTPGTGPATQAVGRRVSSKGQNTPMDSGRDVSRFSGLRLRSYRHNPDQRHPPHQRLRELQDLGTSRTPISMI